MKIETRSEAMDSFIKGAQELGMVLFFFAAMYALTVILFAMGPEVIR